MMGWCGLDWSGSGYGPVEGFCEYGNEPPGSLKCWEVLEWLHSWWPLEQCSDLQSQSVSQLARAMKGFTTLNSKTFTNNFLTARLSSLHKRKRVNTQRPNRPKGLHSEPEISFGLIQI
jgi:hypothetical protein